MVGVSNSELLTVAPNMGAAGVVVAALPNPGKLPPEGAVEVPNTLLLLNTPDPPVPVAGVALLPNPAVVVWPPNPPNDGAENAFELVLINSKKNDS